MAWTLVLAGQKGGVGKTTVALCLAAEAVHRGLRVLLVDADPQGSARTWGDVAAEAGRPAPTLVAMGATMHRDGQLAQLARGYDLTLVDCPPRHGEIQRSALLCADLVILPCGPSAVDAWALSASLELVQEARALAPALRAHVLITRKQGRTALGKGARAVLAASGLPVLTTELGYRIAYQEALAAGQGVTTYAPRDPAAAEARALLDEVRTLLEGPNDDHPAQQKARRRPAKAAR
jgi:chromosome partitioning protein